MYYNFDKPKRFCELIKSRIFSRTRTICSLQQMCENSNVFRIKHYIIPFIVGGKFVVL